ncbi:MAG: hypothetical protein IJT14_04260 [Rickettsiales bacterium]|nr:hypothetical protein [Rickettsiales bacterium]
MSTRIARYQRMLKAKSHNQAPIVQEVTPAKLLRILEAIPPKLTDTQFDFNPGGVPQDPNNAIAWDGVSVPPYNANYQAALKQGIEQALQATGNQAYTIMGGGGNDNGGIGPLLNIAQINNIANTGALNQSSVANSMVKCIVGYQIYRGFRRSRSGSNQLDEDDVLMLRKLAKLQRVLKGDLPNADMDVNAVIADLEDISTYILNHVERVVKKPVVYNPDKLAKDERFTINLQRMRQLDQNLANSHDAVSEALNALNPTTDYRIYDVISVLTDSIRSISLKKGSLTRDDSECVNHTVTLINSFLDEMSTVIHNHPYSGVAHENDRVRKGMERVYPGLKKKVYLSLSESLTRLLDRALEDYDHRAVNRGILEDDPRLAVEKYSTLITPAQTTVNKLRELNTLLDARGLNPIDNTVADELYANKELFRNIIGD